MRHLMLIFALIPLITLSRPRAESPLAQKEGSVRFNFVYDLLGQGVSALDKYH